MPTLYVVGTPIGNLEDITHRAVRILGDVQLIAAEDTRKAQILLRHYDVHTPVTSFFEANERKKIPDILMALAEGDVALISEAGMPGISDPGYPLIAAAIEQGVRIVPVPGPSAHTAALVASGLPTDQFAFLGFLPRRHPESVLEAVASLAMTLVFYEAPHRLQQTLERARRILGNRRVALCRELTKVYEEVWRGDLEGALALIEATSPRGEYTIVVEGVSAEAKIWSEAEVRAAMAAAVGRGLSRSQAAREVGQRSGWPRRKVYDLPLDPQ